MKPQKDTLQPTINHSDSSYFNKGKSKSFFSKSSESPTPFFKRSIVQPKLSIGQPNDKYEKEADAVADTVVQRIAQPSLNSPINIQRKCSECDEEENIQTKSKSGNGKTSDNFENELNNSKGKGSPLPKNTRAEMETGFGSSFENVKIHTDSNAVQMSQQISAHAFTNGNDIYFNKNKYRPQNTDGKKLLAHELTHTIQQKGSSTIQRNDIDDCTDDQKKYIQERHDAARKHLSTALAYTIKAQKSPKAKKALKKWFKIDLDKKDIRELKNLIQVEKALKTTLAGSKDVSYECDTTGFLELCDDGINAIALWSVHLCPSWWKQPKDRQEMILIHEWMHKYGGGVNRVFETYCRDSGWKDLTPEERVSMPDAYEGYISELVFGKGSC